MSLKPVPDLFSDAINNGYALGYFESWNLESLQGVLDAAEETRSPIIIGFNGEFLTHEGRLSKERIQWYGALGKAAAESASIPCGFIFNECPGDHHVRQAATAGFNLVMMADPDASYEDYERRVRDLVRYVHPKNVAVEAEIGELPIGASGRIDITHSNLTDPELAARFVAATDVDLLSVSVGNVHILLNGKRDLDLDRLENIHRHVNIPLGLHGGTSIPEDSLKQAIRLGVTKVAYGTYLKQRYLDTVRKALNSTEVNPHKLLGMGGEEDVLVAGRLSVRDAVLERIELLGCCGKA